VEYTLGMIKLERRSVSTPEEALKVLEPFRHVPKEVMVVIHVKPDLTSESLQKAAIGNAESCCFETGDIFREAITHDAGAIIMAHSHPWQRKIQPTEEDVRLTRAMSNLGNQIRVPVLDHIVFGREDFYSFRSKGKVLRPMSSNYEIRKGSGSRIKSTILRMIAKVSTGFIIR